LSAFGARFLVVPLRGTPRNDTLGDRRPLKLLTLDVGAEAFVEPAGPFREILGLEGLREMGIGMCNALLSSLVYTSAVYPFG